MAVRDRTRGRRAQLEWPGVLRPEASPRANMTLARAKHHRQGAARGRAGDRHPGGTDLHGVTRKLRCAVYTRKSSEDGLEMEFNSLDAQRAACEACIASQRGEGWIQVADRYDDGGVSGGTLDRPALKRLVADIEAGRIEIVARQSRPALSSCCSNASISSPTASPSACGSKGSPRSAASPSA